MTSFQFAIRSSCINLNVKVESIKSIEKELTNLKNYVDLIEGNIKADKAKLHETDTALHEADKAILTQLIDRDGIRSHLKDSGSK